MSHNSKPRKSQHAQDIVNRKQRRMRKSASHRNVRRTKRNRSA